MPAADTARLIASLELRDDKFIAGLGRVEKGIGRLGVKTTALGTGLGLGLERLAEKGIGAFFSSLQAGQDSLHELQDVEAQTAAVIASTGGAAGVTAQQVRDLANAQEDLTTADDKSIQKAENLLLTFTGIGKDVFPDATKAVVNLGIAMAEGDAANADFHASAIQVGKALNDPIKGVTALQKVGVSFTEQQKKQIKALVEAGKVEEAQKVILGELATEFGKAGEAAGTSGAAGARRLNDAVEDLQTNLAQGLDPALTHIRDKLGVVLKDPKTQQAVRDLGRFLGDAAEQAVKFAEDIPWDKVASALRTAAGFAGDLIKTFTSLPPEAQATIIALAGLNKLSGGAVTGLVSELGKGLIKGVLGITAAQVNIKAATVSGVPGGVPGAAPTSGPLANAAKLLGAVTVVGFAAVAASELGTAIVNATGGPSGGQGNKIPGTPIIVGQSQAALVHPLEEINKNTKDIPSVDKAVTAAAAASAVRDNAANERLEAIRGFTETSATAADEAKKAQVAAIQAASAAEVHTTERGEQNIVDKIRELNAQARTAAQLAAGDSRSEQAAIAMAASTTASASNKAGDKAALAGNVVSSAINRKDLSVTLKNYLTVTTSISVANDLNAKNNYKSVYKVAS